MGENMGEKIKNIEKAFGFLDIELNKATIEGGPRYIHIQNPKVRYCITESEFLQIAVTLKKAIKVFKHNKGIK